MIGISYYSDDRDTYYNMQLFDTKEEARLWLIDEVISNDIINYWFDGDKDDKGCNCIEYDEEEDIRNSMLNMELEKIIKRLQFLIRIKVIIVEK